MAQLDGKWIADDAVDGSKVKLNNNESLRGRNVGDTLDIDIVKVNAADKVEFPNQPQFSGTPVDNADLTNKAYVLDVMAGQRDPKDACQVASTSNVDIATGGLINVDGVVLTAGARVLLKNQTDPTENGIYMVAVGAWARSTDADNTPANEVSNGMSTLITDGTINARKIYLLTSADPIVLGTTNMTFAQAPNPANFLIPKTYTVAVDATIEANGYFDIPHLVEAESVGICVLGGIPQEYAVDFTVAENAGVSRVTFAGDLATWIADGDKLLVTYSYATT